jgi:hypothetical protein
MPEADGAISNQGREIIGSHKPAPKRRSMQILTIQVAQDHIDSLSKARKRIFGLARLS